MIHRPILPRQIFKNGGKVWRVRVPKDLKHAEGQTYRFFGENEKAATKYARQLTEARSSLGSEFLRLTAPEQSAVLLALREVGVDGLMQAVALFRRQRARSMVSTQALVNELIAGKKNAGIRQSSAKVMSAALVTLAAQGGDRPISAWTPELVAAWLDGNGWGAKTRHNYLGYARQFFRWVIQIKKLLEENPAEGVEMPKVAYKARPILSPADWGKLLAVTLRDDPALLGNICPVLFGGLREAESQRTSAENFKHGVIDLDSGGQTKLNMRRAVKVSAQLKAWLKVPGVEFGGADLIDRRAAVCRTAGVVWQKNCHRHSFCSYMLELHGPRETARAANHSEGMLFAHYAHKVTRKDAEAFFALRPVRAGRAIVK